MLSYFRDAWVRCVIWGRPIESVKNGQWSFIFIWINHNPDYNVESKQFYIFQDKLLVDKQRTYRNVCDKITVYCKQSAFLDLVKSINKNLYNSTPDRSFYTVSSVHIDIFNEAGLSQQWEDWNAD
jgi:hypothetical protein